MLSATSSVELLSRALFILSLRLSSCRSDAALHLEPRLMSSAIRGLALHFYPCPTSSCRQTQNRKMRDREISSSCARFARDGLNDLLSYSIQVERSGFLNGRELDESLAELRHLLLDEDEAPEFILEPLSLLHGLPQSRSLQRVQAEVSQDRPVNLDRAAQPALRLINEAVLVVA